MKWTSILIASFVLLGCESGDPPADEPASAEIWFEEVAAASGLRFEHDSGHDGERYLLPESIAGGAALFDMDGDGDLDAYLVQAGPIEGGDRPPNRLFRNRGDGTFDDVTGGSGAEDRRYGIGVACGDADGDGDVDLYVTNLGRNTLLLNDGRGSFTDVTDDAGVGDDGLGTGAAFVDYDHDGDLDLYVCNYVNWSIAAERTCHGVYGRPDYCKPTNYDAPGGDRLFRNEGGGRFRDVSDAAGIGAWPATGLGVVCGDFTDDGLVDIFVANDAMRDLLWVNRGDGTFAEDARRFGCAYDQEGFAKAGMGVVAEDFDDDRDLDLIVCNLRGESDSVYRNQEGRYLADVTIATGLGWISKPFTRFGMGLADFDQDGHLDLYQANGRVMRAASAPAEGAYAEPNLLFRGSAGPSFEEVRPRGGTRSPLVATSRAAAFGDVDGDGDLDVLVVNRDGPAHLLRNVAPTRGHDVILDVRDAAGAPAIGATLTIEVAGRRLTRVVRATWSYLASNDPRVHLGLGAATAVESIEVRWSDGTTAVFGPVAAGEVHTLRAR